MLLMGPAGLVAILAGWFTTEIGRQPWIIYGMMRTADAVSPVSATQLGIGLAVFVVVYCLVFGTGTGYLLKIIAKGPHTGVQPQQAPEGGPGEARSPSRPLSAAQA
jgi:cytochrome bd ubiquinol oxidase subunit I